MKKTRLFLWLSEIREHRLRQEPRSILLGTWQEAFSGTSPEEFFRWCSRLRDAGIRFRTRTVRGSAPCRWGHTVYYIYVRKNDAPLSEQIIRK